MYATIQLAKSSAPGGKSRLAALNALVFLKGDRCFLKAVRQSTYRKRFLECSGTALLSSGGDNTTSFVWYPLLQYRTSLSQSFLGRVFRANAIPPVLPSSHSVTRLVLFLRPADGGPYIFRTPPPRQAWVPFHKNAFLALGAGHASPQRVKSVRALDPDSRVASRKGVPSDIRAKQHWRK
jgi:hypothetical protein